MLFSPERRDSVETGCPLGAAASEIARHGSDISARYARAFEELVAILEEALDADIPACRRRRLAVATITAQIGAIAVSRAVAKANISLSDEVLRAVHENIDTTHKVEIGLVR